MADILRLRKKVRSPHDLNAFTVDEQKAHEAYTGHTEDDAAQRDAITHEYPTTPGSSTGEVQIETFRGIPGSDYEASWGISVSMRRLPWA